MATQRVAIDWDGLERALTRRSRESEAFLDTRDGDIVWVTRGWSDDHGFSDPELDEGLAARRLVPVLPVPPADRAGLDARLRGVARRRLAARHAPRRARGALPRTCGSRTRSASSRRTGCAGSPAGTRGSPRCVRAWLEANDIEPTTEPPRRYAGLLAVGGREGPGD